MEVNGCEDILNMTVQGKEISKEEKRRKHETSKHSKKGCCNRVVKPVCYYFLSGLHCK